MGERDQPRLAPCHCPLLRAAEIEPYGRDIGGKIEPIAAGLGGVEKNGRRRQGEANRTPRRHPAVQRSPQAKPKEDDPHPDKQRRRNPEGKLRYPDHPRDPPPEHEAQRRHGVDLVAQRLEHVGEGWIRHREGRVGFVTPQRAGLVADTAHEQRGSSSQEDQPFAGMHGPRPDPLGGDVEIGRENRHAAHLVTGRNHDTQTSEITHNHGFLSTTINCLPKNRHKNGSLA